MTLKRKAICSMAVVVLAAPMVAHGGSSGGGGGNSCSKVNVVINPGNQTVAESSIVGGQRIPTTVTMDGSNSNPKDLVVCQWTQLNSDTAKVSIQNSAPCTASFSAPDVGASGADLHFELKVTSQESGCTTSDTKTTTVTVTNANNAPTASASAPAAVNEGATITLDGSTSSDPDGDLLTYTWTQVAGTAVGLAPVNSFGSLVSFTAPPEQYPGGENLKFQLTVSDGSLSSTAEIVVAVNSVNLAPTAAISCPATVTEGAAVTLSGNNSSDPDLDALSYQWSQILGGPSPDLSNNSFTDNLLVFTAPVLASPKYDTMKFSLTVSDGYLSNSAECDVKVLDITPPVISGLADLTMEATSEEGATVTFDPAAHDAFYGDVAVTCTPVSGSTFALGVTPVICSAVDGASNQADASFNVTIVDTTPPTLKLPSLPALEGSDLGGAKVFYTVSATDLVDGTVSVTCTPASGTLFHVGTSAVTCTASDTHGNKAADRFDVTIIDTTPPALSIPAPITEEASAATGNTVSFQTSASDIVDGPLSVTCAPQSGSTFPIGTTTVSCSATDKSGNIGTSLFTIKVQDTTAPVVSQPGDVTVYATGLLTPVNFGTAIATDIVGVESLLNNAPAAGFPVGTTTITWTAKDKAGNIGLAQSTVTVKPWTLTGFYSPIDMNGVTNTVKGGATVPMKFKVFSGASELTNSAAVSSIRTVAVSCSSMSAAEDALPLEALATGNTVLRYDAVAGHFIFNWQTPKAPGTCYAVTLTTADGSKIAANFKLK